MNREAIVEELIRHGGNKTAAAAALGIHRGTLHRKIDSMGIAFGPLVPLEQAKPEETGST